MFVGEKDELLQRLSGCVIPGYSCSEEEQSNCKVTTKLDVKSHIHISPLLQLSGAESVVLFDMSRCTRVRILWDVGAPDGHISQMTADYNNHDKGFKTA